MTSKAVIVCVFAFLIQCIAAQRNCGCSCQSITVSDNGGALIVRAVGPIAPSGIAVATELGLSGDLDVSGALPYLSAIKFEGQFPTSGSAAVDYGCGSRDNVAITQQIGGPSGNAGYGGYGCGCGCGI